MKRLLRRMFPSLPLSLAVFFFGILLTDEITPGFVLVALLLALLVPQLARRLEREFAHIGSLRPLPKLVLVILYDIVVANLHVARLVLGPRHRIRPGWIWIPLELTNIHGITALATLITVTPGTVAAELSDDRRYMLVHVLDMDDSQHEIRVIKTRYEKPLLEMFP
jgi:multicomponent K+:H+ antiporter subunit E